MSRLQLWFTLALLFASTLASGMIATAQPSDSEATALHQLAMRLLVMDGKGQILVGRLPNQLPVSLPLPDQTQIIGSIVRGPKDFEILLDVAQSPELVKFFYRKQLLSAGWNEREISPSRIEEKGFLDRLREDPLKVKPVKRSIDEPTIFCSGSQQADLHIETKSASNSPTDVRLHLYINDSASFSFPFSCFPGSRAFETAPLPALNPPPDVEVYSKGSACGPSECDSSAVIETKLDAIALASHYDTEFEKAGWRRHDGKQEGPLVWSTWRLKDKNGHSWQGLLIVRQIWGVPNQYKADAQVSWTEP